MTRIASHPAESIDRSEEVTFVCEGKPVRAFRGDTIGSALYASGRRVFSRSFKYHRPRGLLCCTGHCANCQMTVDGEPNVRVCVTPARTGAVVTGQNYVGSLDRDLMRVVDKLGGPFTPPGFYYKTFIRPRRLWPLYERVLRAAAGLGRLDPNGARGERVEVVHARADVVVIGGGEAGLEAAAAAATGGDSVILVDEGPDVGGALLADREGHERAAELRERAIGAGVELLVPAVAIGVFEDGLVPVAHGSTLVRIRAAKVVVAAGAVEQPLVFPGNDLVGVMLPEAVRRLVNLWSIRPAERAYVVTADDRGLAAASDLAAAGVDVVGVLDLRDEQPSNIEAQRSAGSRRGARGRRPRHAMRSRGDVREPAAQLQAARAGGCTRDLRRRSRGVRAGRPPPGRGGGGRRRGRDRRAGGAEAGARPSGGEVLRLLLRGPDEEGSRGRHRGGVRLDRALEAVHDGDDGPLPGAALPPQLDPHPRDDDRGGREHDRHDDGATTSRAGDPGAARRPPARAGETDCASPPSRGARREDDVDGTVAAATLVWARPGSRGPARPPRRGPDRRLHPRQDSRRGRRRGSLPRPRLSQPVLRPRGGPDPLRRAHRRLRPDHGRRHRRPAGRGDVLRHDDLDRRRRGLPVVHVVERGVAHGRPDRAADRVASPP